MKTFLILFFASSVLFSCKKIDKESFNEICTDSCTVIQGRFITGMNEGIANVPIEIKSQIRTPSGLGFTTVRKIASTTTDNNGFYSVQFSLKEEEYGSMASANLSINFTYDKSNLLNVDWYESFGASENLVRPLRKDTTITANIFLASKSKLRVRLENFLPVQPGDEFSVITSCGTGFERQYRSGGLLVANQTTVEQEIDVCGNQETTVIVRKRKNGVSSSTSSTVFVPTGQTLPITFVY